MSVDCTSSVVWGGLVSDDSSESEDIYEIAHDVIHYQNSMPEPASTTTTSRQSTNNLNSFTFIQPEVIHIRNTCDDFSKPFTTEVEFDLTPEGNLTESVLDLLDKPVPSVIFLNEDQSNYKETNQEIEKFGQKQLCQSDANIFMKLESDDVDSKEIANGNVSTCCEPLLDSVPARPLSVPESLGLEATDAKTPIELVLEDLTECENRQVAPGTSLKYKEIKRKYKKRVDKIRKMKLEQELIDENNLPGLNFARMKKTYVKRKPLKAKIPKPKLKAFTELPLHIYSNRKMELVERLKSLNKCDVCGAQLSNQKLKWLHMNNCNQQNENEAAKTTGSNSTVEQKSLNDEKKLGSEISLSPQNDDIAAHDDDNDVLVVKTVRKNLFNCPFCLLDFSSENDLKGHFSVIHVTSHKRGCCRFCRLHLSESEEKNETPYWMSSHPVKYDKVDSVQRCTICGAMFYKNKTAFKRHLAVHSDEKTLKCTSCDSSFGDFSELRSHVLNQSCWRTKEKGCILLCHVERLLTNSFKNVKNCIYKEDSMLQTCNKIPETSYVQRLIENILTKLSEEVLPKGIVPVKVKNKKSPRNLKETRQEENGKALPEAGRYISEPKSAKGKKNVGASNNKGAKDSVLCNERKRGLSEEAELVCSIENVSKKAAKKNQKHKTSKNIEKRNIRKSEKRSKMNKILSPGLTGIVVTNVVSLAENNEDEIESGSEITVISAGDEADKYNSFAVENDNLNFSVESEIDTIFNAVEEIVNSANIGTSDGKLNYEVQSLDFGAHLQFTDSTTSAAHEKLYLRTNSGNLFFLEPIVDAVINVDENSTDNSYRHVTRDVENEPFQFTNDTHVNVDQTPSLAVATDLNSYDGHLRCLSESGRQREEMSLEENVVDNAAKIDSLIIPQVETTKSMLDEDSLSSDYQPVPKLKNNESFNRSVPRFKCREVPGLLETELSSYDSFVVESKD